ncbi:unnamed protein product [Nesidiocoris tenuis]|uniref:Uncharacterized protein n=1 Tax=Nesidiocoris tenuis TaxID=355587 RepID=A0A6H5G9S0_9HEMI|nr:unnamed protein product [Nesidiocoris tenuis]
MGSTIFIVNPIRPDRLSPRRLSSFLTMTTNRQLPEEALKSPKSPRTDPTLFTQKKKKKKYRIRCLQPPIKLVRQKKTSVVTLGQGNVVLIDKQDSNFKVTGNSKESILDDDPPQKNFSDKKVKKVEFCKTEVHFAPDSGKVNIVETDEKPPSSQLLRRKKRLKKDVAPAKTVMPKLYFGGAERELFFDNKAKLKVDDEKIKKHSFPVIREPSPLLSTGITSLNQLVRPDSADSWDRLAKNKPNGASSGDYAVPEKVKHDIPTVQTARMDDLRHKKSKIDLPGAQQNITPNKINFVGNVRKDTSHYALPKKKSSRTDLKVAETIIPIKLDTNELQNKPQISYCSEDDAVQISGDKIKKCDIKPEDSAKTSYLGNVSPKLSKLIKNDIQHEFQLKQLEIMRKGRAADVTVLHESRESSPKASDSMPQTTAPIHIQVTPEVPQMKMASSTVISEDNLSSNKKNYISASAETPKNLGAGLREQSSSQKCLTDDQSCPRKRKNAATQNIADENFHR